MNAVQAGMVRALVVLAAMGWSGPGAAQSATDQPDLTLYVNGEVNAIVRQPDGGVVFGGVFDSVNGTPRQNIARLLPTGALDPTWNPRVFGSVSALAVDGTGAVFVGGFFGSAGGATRQNLAKLSGTGTGTADATWNPGASNGVNAIAFDGVSAVYIGGFFTSAGGQTRARLAKLTSTGTGAADATWNPGADNNVTALKVVPTGLIVGGSFQNVGGIARSFLAKLARTGVGAIDVTWNPVLNGAVLALDSDGTGAVYLAGSFTTVSTVPRNRLALVAETGTGALNATWDPSANDTVMSLSVISSTQIYVGGRFSAVGGTVRGRVAKLTGTNGSADANWNPFSDGEVRAVSANSSGAAVAGGVFRISRGATRLSFSRINVDGTVAAAVDVQRPGAVRALGRQANGGLIVGGDFASANGLVRNNVLRLLPSGALDGAWAPSVNSTVYAIAVFGSEAVYLGGTFTLVGNTQRTRIARVSGSGAGDLDLVWEGGSNNAVYALVTDASGTVYAGGAFTGIGGALRNRIARLSGTDGLADPSWNPSANELVFSIALSGGDAYAAGFFTNIGGMARNGLAKIAGATGSTVASWNPAPSGSPTVVAAAPDGSIFAAGGFGMIGGLPRNGVAKISAAGVVDPQWDPAVMGFVDAVAVDDSGAVYLGGSFFDIGGSSLSRLARVSGTGTGAVDMSFNAVPNDNVIALRAGNETLDVGGVFTTIGEQSRMGVAHFSFTNNLFTDGFE